MSAGHSHMQDFEGHVEAVATDYEYFRRKRVENKILYSLRKGVVTFAELLRAHDALGWPERPQPPEDLEQRIRALEDSLDELVMVTAVVRGRLRSYDIAIEDTRRERGDYDEFFRLYHRTFDGSLEERIAALEEAIWESTYLVAAYTRALVASM